MQKLNTNELMRIGELAAKLGLNPRTIRYYEKLGLIPASERTPSGYRIYDTTDRERLRFILKAKAIGLTLEEIGEILALRREGSPPCEHVITLLDNKITGIDQQLLALNDFRQDLVALREEVQEDMQPDEGFCRIIERHKPLHPQEFRPSSLVALELSRHE